MNLGEPRLVDDLVAWAGESGPWDLIIVDTLARAVPGVEENSAKEMGAAIQAAERLKQGGGSVLLVHHSGHGSDRGRGSSAVLAAADNVINCFPVEGHEGRGGRDLRIKVSSEKLKDGRASRPRFYDGVEVPLGSYDGEPQSSIVLQEVDSEESSAEEQEARRAALRVSLRDARAKGEQWTKDVRDTLRKDDREWAKSVWDGLPDPARAA